MTAINSEQPPKLSAYEQLRLDNINRNEAKLKELGLIKPLVVDQKFVRNKSINHKSRKAPVTSFLKRTSTRKRKAVSYYAPDDVDDEVKSVKISEDEGESDYEQNDMVDEDGSDNENVCAHLQSSLTPLPKRRAIQTSVAITTIEETKKTGDTLTVVGGIICEYAKSGRSTCRKCRDKIEKNAPRVGMQAWIVGRQATTWQCPPCFLSNLTCAYETTGRSRCQITNQNFAKGDLKVGTRSHNATSFYGFDVIGKILRAVVLHIPPAERGNLGREVLQVDRINGYQKLSEQDHVRLQNILTCALSDQKTLPKVKRPALRIHVQNPSSSTSQNVNLKVKKESSTCADRSPSQQPKLGCRSNIGGRVEWKFGGRLCYGTLLPSKETNTHCYARTHKGNIKTLAKGKDYWSVLR